jgi:transposase
LVATSSLKRLAEAEQTLHGRYDKIELPEVRPVVTRVERYAGHCRACGGVTLAPVPAGLEEGSPFSTNILALALYLRFTHAISYRRLSRLFLHLFALPISEGALDAMFRRARPSLDHEVAAILARLRRARIVCCDETSVRVGGRTYWNWVFQNEQVVIRSSIGYRNSSASWTRRLSGYSRRAGWRGRYLAGLSRYAKGDDRGLHAR